MNSSIEITKIEKLTTAQLWDLRGAVNKALIVQRSSNLPRNRVASLIAFGAAQGEFKSSLGLRPPVKVALARTYSLIDQCEKENPERPMADIVRMVVEAL